MTIQPRHILIVAIIAAIVVLVVVLNRPEPVPAEVAINQLIDTGADALRQGEAGDTLDLVSDDFRGQIGGQDFDRESLQRQLTVYGFRGGSIDFTIVSRTLEMVSEGEAVVTMRVVGVRGGLSGALEGDVDAELVELRVELEGDDWKVVSARW